jgi:trehalose 6-phosphate phosphatase
MSELLSPHGAPAVRSLARAGTVVVLDFDGTLAPLVGDHRAAGLSTHSRAVLLRLAGLYPVAVLSGRGAADIRARLEGVPVRWVVGSHGAEWPGEADRHRAWRRLVLAWRTTLTRTLGGQAGLELEAKPLSLTIHYRHAQDRGEAARRVREAAAGLPGVALVGGKMVLNLVPEGAGDKGTALRRLVAVSAARRVLFVGDDVTDEAAFGASLKVPAVMVRVGRSLHSRARYWLRRRTDVDALLERLSELRERPARPVRRRARPGA